MRGKAVKTLDFLVNLETTLLPWPKVHNLYPSVHTKKKAVSLFMFDLCVILSKSYLPLPRSHSDTRATRKIVSRLANNPNDFDISEAEIFSRSKLLLDTEPCHFQLASYALQSRGEHSVLILPAGSEGSLAFFLPFV